MSKAQAASAALHEAESKLLAARATLLEMKAKLAGDTDTYTRTKDASMVPAVVAANEVIILRDMVKSDEERVGNAQENVKASQNQVNASKESESAARKAADNYLDIAAYLTVTAPFDGYITERNMHVGSFVGPLGKTERFSKIGYLANKSDRHDTKKPTKQKKRKGTTSSAFLMIVNNQYFSRPIAENSAYWSCLLLCRCRPVRD